MCHFVLQRGGPHRGPLAADLWNPRHWAGSGDFSLPRRAPHHASMATAHPADTHRRRPRMFLRRPRVQPPRRRTGRLPQGLAFLISCLRIS
jgi:hypothetical protein